MQFDPHNPIIVLCVQGIALQEKGDYSGASAKFLQAWQDATNSYEQFYAAWFMARVQDKPEESLQWLQTALKLSLDINDINVAVAIPYIYDHIAECYQQSGNSHAATENHNRAAGYNSQPADDGPFYHGTRADLKSGDLLFAGGTSNYKADFKMNHIYFTAIVNGAGLAAALAKGEGSERVYIVEPIGPFEHDPNVTNKKFPGNPTRSYRSTAPLKIVGEVTDWNRISPEQLKHWREKLAENNGEIIN